MMKWSDTRKQSKTLWTDENLKKAFKKFGDTLLDPPLFLTRDDNINAMRPRVGGVLLPTVARVKETGAGGA